MKADLNASTVRTKINDYTDEELLMKFRKSRDNRFWNELTRRYQSKFSAYIRKILIVENRVDDVVQDVFLRIYTSLESFDSARRFSSWGYRIAHNCAVNYNRKIGRDMEFGTGTPDDADGVSWLDNQPGDEIDPKEHAENSEVFREVRAAVAELPEESRQILALAYFNNMRQSEIAESLMVAPAVVKKRLRSALTLLRQSCWRRPQFAYLRQLEGAF